MLLNKKTTHKHDDQDKTGDKGVGTPFICSEGPDGTDGFSQESNTLSYPRNLNPHCIAFTQYVYIQFITDKLRYDPTVSMHIYAFGFPVLYI